MAWRIGAAAAYAALASLPAVAGPTPLPPDGAFEARVLAALNFARARPADYAEALRRYRLLFRGARVIDPGQAAEVETAEGGAPVDEAIGLLIRARALAPMAEGRALAAAAADHAADQARSGALGHGDADGASPGDRAVRHGGGPYVAEAIMYGAADAEDVVRQLIVDDGVADRGHRALLLSADYRFAGIACRPHPAFRTVCVIDLSDTPDGREAGAGAMAQ